eukprot:TRINITY_DN17617_c0_g1_i4.p1 TRINITY_DN17617_c0_g1~~TRINITY_DN17617_c0_g1_i4.p1  ORF type:complete len:236 (+),score=17.86 TRINITY_DN17617_c0_g1_i4:72-779(+)
MTLTKMLHVAGLCGIALLLHGCNDCEPESDDPHDEPYDPDEPVEPVDPPPEPPAFEPPAALASGRAERQSHPFAKLATSSRALARRLQNCAAADDNKHDHDKDKDLPEPESEDACESTVRAWASDGICKGLEQLAGAWFDAGIQELKKATKPNATAFCEEMRLDWDKDAVFFLSLLARKVDPRRYASHLQVASKLSTHARLPNRPSSIASYTLQGELQGQSRVGSSLFGSFSCNN